MAASGEHFMVVRGRATVVTSVILVLIAAVAWVDVVRSALSDPDMMMTMFMPMTVSDGLAFVASWGIMMTAMMLPSALPRRPPRQPRPRLVARGVLPRMLLGAHGAPRRRGRDGPRLGAAHRRAR